MDIKLKKEVQKPIIVEGFPGFGLIGAITTEFLVRHLDTEQVGEIMMDKMPATIAIHEGKIVHPIGIYHNSKYNLLIIHSITAPQGLEWELADTILSLARKVNAWELISIEGVGTSQPGEESRAFFFANSKHNQEKLKGIGLEPLEEGIIVGVTSAMMLKGKEMNMTSLFAEAHSQLPDSKAAAKIIEILDKYLGLKVDYKPLLETAEKFEQQIKGILESSQKTNEEKDKKAMNYVG